ncbi:DUF2877 domain-containing protein [Myxococcota bacterium]|nr:DUF2877 domain-containing protein [Myxococcota bacterium]MBU1534365.1 DUF2877 domain-containing protein [Myxococcota bacterium]
MKIAALGDNVPLGTYHFHSRFTHVVNYQNDNGIISFVDSAKDLSGRTLLVSVLPRGEEPVVVFSSHVLVAKRHLSTGDACQYDSSFEGFAPELSLESFVHAMKRVLRTNAPELSLAVLYDSGHEVAFTSSFEKAVLARFKKAFASMGGGDVVDCVDQFKGVGFGLTPSGDDFITGLLYALSSLAPEGALLALKKTILERVQSCTALSFQFMSDAAAGIYPQDIKSLFLCAQSGDDNGVGRHLQDILSHGHSSGADTIAGMVAGFEWFFTQRTSEAGIRIRG